MYHSVKDKKDETKLTMTKFCLSISSNDFIVEGQGEPFGLLFLTAESLQARCEHVMVQTEGFFKVVDSPVENSESEC